MEVATLEDLLGILLVDEYLLLNLSKLENSITSSTKSAEYEVQDKSKYDRLRSIVTIFIGSMVNRGTLKGCIDILKDIFFQLQCR